MKIKKLFKIEKILLVTIALLVIFSAIINIYTKASISSINIETEKIKMSITKQESINESLVMKINELASLSNIQSIAKEYGLNYNNDNITVIKDN